MEYVRLQLDSKDSSFDLERHGKPVTALQNTLNVWREKVYGDKLSPIAVDGVFGKETECLVVEFQLRLLVSELGMNAADGVVGDITWRSLLKATTVTYEILNNDRVFSQHYSWVHDLPEDEDVDLLSIQTKALQFAIDEIKSGAKEIGGNNKGGYVKKYFSPFSPGTESLWCAAFVSWCYFEAAGKDESAMPFKCTAASRGIFKQFENAQLVHYVDDSYKPRPGDLAVWGRCYSNNPAAGHVAIVHSYSDGVLRTIDGNKGDFPAYVRGIEYPDDSWRKLLIGFCDVGAAIQKHG